MTTVQTTRMNLFDLGKNMFFPLRSSSGQTFFRPLVENIEEQKVLFYHAPKFSVLWCAVTSQWFYSDLRPPDLLSGQEDIKPIIHLLMRLLPVSRVQIWLVGLFPPTTLQLFKVRVECCWCVMTKI